MLHRPVSSKDQLAPETSTLQRPVSSRDQLAPETSWLQSTTVQHPHYNTTTLKNNGDQKLQRPFNSRDQKVPETLSQQRPLNTRDQKHQRPKAPETISRLRPFSSRDLFIQETKPETEIIEPTRSGPPPNNTRTEYRALDWPGPWFRPFPSTPLTHCSELVLRYPLALVFHSHPNTKHITQRTTTCPPNTAL